jgi:energy-coupling factor transporter ATP-binding protein EcfA2
VLLAGPSGSGKSTLAYLAHSAAIDVLSDDHVWLQLEPDCRIWGGAPHARLRAEAAAHFPEVDHAGGEKLAIHLPPRDDEHRLVARGPVVCILGRGDRASLAPLAPSEIEAELVSQLSAGFDRFPERSGAAFAAIASGGGWRLILSDNPRDALPLLRRVLDAS